LSLAFRDVLLDIAERLEWSSTWVDSTDEKIALTEQQKNVVEEGIGALSMPCEIVINNNVTVEPGNFTVNANCGGGGGGFLPIPVGPDGEPVTPITYPLNPDDPLGDRVPVFDPETETPPDGWSDWATFTDARCRMANYFLDSLIAVVEQLDEVENQGSLGKSLLEIAVLIVALLPGPIGNTKGIIVVINWLVRIIAWITIALTELEDLNDALQLIVDEIEDHRQELVCAIYVATSVEAVTAIIAGVVVGFIGPQLLVLGLSEDTKNAAIDWLLTVAGSLATFAVDAAVNADIPVGYVPPGDCNSCGDLQLGNGWSMVPLVYDGTFDFFETSGITAHQVQNLGYGVRVSANALAINNVAQIITSWNAPAGAGLWVYGWRLDTGNGQNVNGLGIRSTGEPPTGIDLNQGNTIFSPPENLNCVRDVWVAQFEADTGLVANYDAAAPQERFLEAGGTYNMTFQDRAAGPGAISSDRRLWLICNIAELEV
jgi:hypothetical protein